MFIIKLEASENGSRPPLQSFDGNVAPDGYALCPDEFVDIFYSTSYSGFVDIEFDENTRVVSSMTINQEALDAYVASLPEIEEHQSSPQDDTDSMLVDHEYRITLLELGIV